MINKMSFILEYMFTHMYVYREGYRKANYYHVAFMVMEDGNSCPQTWDC